MMTNLPPEMLRSFLAIADSNSFSLAAKQVHRTQSAVSMQIKKLEEMGLSEKEATRFARIKEHWEEVQHRAEALLAVDPGSKAAMKAEHVHFLQYWHATEKLDHEIDQFIVDLAGKH